MRKYSVHIVFLFIFIIFVIGGCKRNKPQLPPLNETYRKTDKQPFGGFVAFNSLKKFFDNRFVENVTDPFDEFWEESKNYATGEGHSAYFLITKNLVVDYTEVKALLDFAKAGNDLFISADYIDKRLLENIECSNQRDSEIVKEVQGFMQNTLVSMYFGEGLPLSSYRYFYYPFLNSITPYDTTFSRVLGVNQDAKPNYIVLFSGKGRIYLHVAPRIFGNYFLLTGDNHKYFENVISYVRADPQYIYWDEYYKNSRNNKRNSSRRGDNNFSSLSVIWKQSALRWAFLVAISGLFLYILFNSKRNQRLVPVITPVTNSTLDFTRAVGRLYLQKKDNKNMANKIITFFYEHLRNKYFLNITLINDEFLNTLSRRSGMAKESTDKLFSLISHIQSNETVTDEELLALNAGIENFKKINVHGRKPV